MKKNVLKVTVMAFVLSMTLAFSACGSNGGSSGTALEQMLADPSVQSQADALSGDGFKVEMLSENGNVLIYRYTFEDANAVDVSDPSVKEVLDDGLDAQASVFTQTRDSLRSELKMNDLTVRVEYCGADGTVITSRDF